MGKRYFITTESVTEGHPDKVADYISDSILDECLKQDRNSRVAIETMLSKDKVSIAGQITSNSKFDIEQLVREKLKEVGYTDESINMDYRTCIININISKQSNDIAMGVDYGGAGDQGIMFGFACDETDNFMPYGIELAHKLSKQLADVRKNGEVPYLKSDGKVQVTIEYMDEVPMWIDKIVISTQHEEGIEIRQIQRDVLEKVVFPIVDKDMITNQTIFFINPTGSFVVGGAIADTGLTGRKIIVDTYGGYGRHGGGAFSGKDPTKVDRSAAYAARWVAKNLVAAGVADKLEIQLAYAIGVAKPVSIEVDTFGTGKISDQEITSIVEKVFDLRPGAIIRDLELRRPLYRQTAAYGHFGRNDLNLPWEELNKVEEIKRYL